MYFLPSTKFDSTAVLLVGTRPGSELGLRKLSDRVVGGETISSPLIARR